MFRIVHHRKKCIGCFACVEAAPHRWRINRKDGRAVLIDGKGKKDIYMAQVSEDELSENEEASINCPAGIIRIEK